jgi:hypothetical protein
MNKTETTNVEAKRQTMQRTDSKTVLIYKRTHTGDPDESGCFGCRCCMGRVRDRDFAAVIGVGGVGQEPVEAGIARKITWIGIGPRQVGVADDGYPVWAFEHFYLKDKDGKLLSDKAPRLARRMFGRNGPREIMAEPDEEINAVLKLAGTSNPSPQPFSNYRKAKCCNRQ